MFIVETTGLLFLWVKALLHYYENRAKLARFKEQKIKFFILYLRNP
jgi:hypothetical protein